MAEARHQGEESKWLSRQMLADDSQCREAVVRECEEEDKQTTENEGHAGIIVGTGGETLDAAGTTDTTTADPSGNPNFDAENLEAATGQFWGVMRLTLNQNGYMWDFESH